MVLGAQPRSAVVPTTGAQRRIVERINLLASIGAEGNVNPRRIRFTLSDSEVQLSGLSETSHETEARYGSVKLM